MILSIFMWCDCEGYIKCKWNKIIYYLKVLRMHNSIFNLIAITNIVLDMLNILYVKNVIIFIFLKSGYIRLQTVIYPSWWNSICYYWDSFLASKFRWRSLCWYTYYSRSISWDWKLYHYLISHDLCWARRPAYLGFNQPVSFMQASPHQEELIPNWG